MLRTAQELASAQYKQEARHRALNIVLNNGYNNVELSARISSPRYVPGVPALHIPFLSDSFSIKVQKIFQTHGLTINIAPKPAKTLRQILVRSRLYDNTCDTPNCWTCTGSAGLCKLKGTVYKISCAEYAEYYIGETGRPLAQRIKEHVADIRHNGSRDGPWACHAREKHNGRQIEVRVEVIAVERNVHERKIKEALYIKKFSPKINGRIEMTEAMKFIQTL